MKLDRRQFGVLGAQALAAVASQRAWSAMAAPATAERFHFAVVADPHVIDEFYVKGTENGVEDNESILRTTERLTSARTLINSLQPKMEQVFVVGDCFHNYPSADYDFYFKNKTRIDITKEMFDDFDAPVHLGFGNHDYDVPRVSREMSHRLFAEKLKARPYSVLDYKGFRFVHLNNFMGATWDASSSHFNKGLGSLGEEQLNWFEGLMAERKPTVVFIHYPLWLVSGTEVSDYGLHPLLRKHRESIQMVISGHWHKWVDFAHTYGPQHYVSAATRYDPNAYMLFEADGKKQTMRWMNADLVEWSTHYSKPFVGRG
jgi:UDP-2,3-diacylglucosamine pyrophosphatase LpxH